MWTKEEIETWIFSKFEFIENVFTGYFKLLFGICFRPKKTFKDLHNNEVISPFIFFAMNLFFAGIFESFGNLNEFMEKLLKALILTTKPNFDEAFYSMLGLLAGTLLFIFIFRFVSKLSYASITKPVLYASFLFIPIVILNSLIGSFFISQLFKAFENLKIGPAFTYLFLIYILVFGWWSYVFYVSLRQNFAANINIQYGRNIFNALLFLCLITFVTTNIKNIEKISSLTYLSKYKNTADAAMSKNPPDYFSAATATMFMANTKSMSPYRRYCEKIRSVVYFSALINGFDIPFAISKLNKYQFEEVEKYYLNVIDKVAATSQSLEEHRYLKSIRQLLKDAEKDKQDEEYLYGEYKTTYSVGYGFRTQNTGIRIIP